MNPPPPRLPAAGCVTANAKATAIAASTALPPRFMISTPTRDATSLVDATMPFRALTGWRPAARAPWLLGPVNQATLTRMEKMRANAVEDFLFIFVMVEPSIIEMRPEEKCHPGPTWFLPALRVAATLVRPRIVKATAPLLIVQQKNWS